MLILHEYSEYILRVLSLCVGVCACMYIHISAICFHVRACVLCCICVFLFVCKRMIYFVCNMMYAHAWARACLFVYTYMNGWVCMHLCYANMHQWICIIYVYTHTYFQRLCKSVYVHMHTQAPGDGADSVCMYKHMYMYMLRATLHTRATHTHSM